MINKKRLKISLIAGAFLGIFCIIGVGYRLGYAGNEVFLFANWYNRVVMGLLIGLIADIKIVKSKYNPLVRGLLFGLIVSSALFFTSELRDPLGFIAGIIYGIIIDSVATKYS